VNAGPEQVIVWNIEAAKPAQAHQVRVCKFRYCHSLVILLV